MFCYHSCSGSHLGWWQVRKCTRSTIIGRHSAVLRHWDCWWCDDCLDQTEHYYSNKANANIYDLLWQPARCAHSGKNYFHLNLELGILICGSQNRQCTLAPIILWLEESFFFVWTCENYGWLLLMIRSICGRWFMCSYC